MIKTYASDRAATGTGREEREEKEKNMKER
jgi:hypothetical protein